MGGYGAWQAVPDSVVAEITQRTPGFTGWQQERWLYHCAEPAAFLGRVGYEQIRELPDALDALLTRYRSLVRTKARSYFLVGADREDVVQEGMIGLYKAIRDFDAARQTTFRGFADLCVTRQIISAIKSATRQKHSPLNGYVSLHLPAYQDDEPEQELVDHVVSADLDPADRVGDCRFELWIIAWQSAFQDVEFALRLEAESRERARGVDRDRAQVGRHGPHHHPDERPHQCRGERAQRTEARRREEVHGGGDRGRRGGQHTGPEARRPTVKSGGPGSRAAKENGR